jgi:release factor glutamine methyltransferase
MRPWEHRPVTTWGELVRRGRERLPEPRYPAFEAEELLATAAGQPRAFLHGRRREEAPFGVDAAFDRLLERRAGGEPLQYLLGEWEFRGRTFQVDPRALIPRGETEAIVDLAAGAAPHARRALDAGTGTGILAVSLALELPSVSVVALDRSVEALALARRNAARHGVAGRVSFVASDWLSGLRGTAPFDLAVSNPPYVPLADAPHLDKTVSEHEPALALYGGDDGLDPLRLLVATLPRLLAPGAPFVFELGYGQAGAASDLLASSPDLDLVSIRLDQAGIPRTGTAIRR